MNPKFKDDVKWLLEQAAFHRVMAQWMSRTKVFGTTYTGNEYSLFLEGNRAFVMEMFIDLMNTDKEAAFKILERSTQT